MPWESVAYLGGGGPPRPSPDGNNMIAWTFDVQ